MYALWHCLIHPIIKCSYMIQMPWNFAWWLLTWWWICVILFGIFWYCLHCLGHMYFRCDNLCHTMGCLAYAFSFPYQLNFDDADFWYDDYVWPFVCSWKFPELFESFLFWYGILIHDDHLCALKLSLSSFAHIMTLINDFDLALFMICSWLIKIASCWISIAVLTFYSIFDLRLCPRGLNSHLSCVFQDQASNLHGWCCLLTWALIFALLANIWLCCRSLGGLTWVAFDLHCVYWLFDYCLSVDSLSEYHTDWLVVYTGNLAALAHSLSCFALLVVGIPLR
jgi:hypothetical protein